MPVDARAPGQRSVAIDALRVLGILAVAAGHRWAGSPGSDDNVVRLLVYPWHVPLFFFLSGWFWTPGRSIRTEARRRARTLLLPFAAWALLIGVPYWIVLAVQGTAPGPAILSTVTGGGALRWPFSPYWFLPVLFCTAVLARALERLPRRVSWASALAVLALCYPFGDALAHVPHDAVFAVPCLLFLLAGQELARHRDRLRHPVAAALAALAVCAALVATHVSAPVDLKGGDFGTPVLSMAVAIVICGALTLLARAALDGWRGRGRSAVTELATTLLVVLLTHTLLFSALGPVTRFAGAWQSGLVFVLGLAIAWAAATVLHRTALSPVLVGAPRHPRQQERAAAVDR